MATLCDKLYKMSSAEIRARVEEHLQALEALFAPFGTAGVTLVIRVPALGEQAELVMTNDDLNAACAAFLRGLGAEEAPPWVLIKDSDILRYRYQRSTKRLEVQYQRGAVYLYEDVPAQVIDALAQASSKGAYLRYALKDLKFERIG